jgi:nucleotide-binding universal stress UspA family protein
MNPTISRILVPVDFSAHTTLAIHYASMLSLKTGASIHLLHVIEPISAMAFGGEMYIPDLVEVYAEIINDAERRMANAKALVPDTITVTTGIRTGHPASIIVGTAADQRTDLIVMGSHGRTGLVHLLLGSVAEKVTRLASCPVLTVRHTGESEHAQHAA